MSGGCRWATLLIPSCYTNRCDTMSHHESAIDGIAGLLPRHRRVVVRSIAGILAAAL